jgi:ATP-dependent RNA helicase DHX29
MAPKKKKKPAANPARGFATTSLPSKSKTVARLDDAPVAPDEQSREAGSHTPVPASQDPADAEGEQSTGGLQIQDMSPEELEAHLENSELEAILDKYGATAMTGARRQVTRLETERRQLRLQTQKLSTYNWLPEEMIRELFESANEDELATSAAGHVNLHGTDEENLVVDLWTLERVLRSLHFPKVSEAIAYIAELALSNQVTPIVDSVPGLAEALQWYAGNTQSDGLTNYEQTTTTKTERSGESTPAQILSGE